MSRWLSEEESLALVALLESRIEDFDKYEFLLEGQEAEGVVWLERDGGGEGGAEYCTTIFSVDGKYYSWQYSYYSHSGFEIEVYNSIGEVIPVEKTVVFYE